MISYAFYVSLGGYGGGEVFVHNQRQTPDNSGVFLAIRGLCIQVLKQLIS
jgi:hypothetical protein